jgi:hypothetical protein
MAIGLNPLLSPSPTVLVGVLFPIHSLVALSGLEFPADEIFDLRTAPPSGSQGP